MSRKNEHARLLATTATALLIMGAGWTSAHAQEATTIQKLPACTPDSTEARCVEERQAASEAAATQEVVVTGTRLRSTFTSIAPLQTVNADVARNFGFLDVADILSVGVTTINGLQLNTNLTTSDGFVTRNGAGTSALSLRNLGADRTLTLINGKRLGPSGVGGAPTNADSNVIPNIIIRRADTITDGASSVYGSDAVAGVINLIVDNDFDGVEARGNFSVPQEGGGYVQRYAVKFGKKFDKGGFIFAAEYLNQKEIRLNQRDFQRLPGTNRFCEQSIFVTPGQNAGSAANELRLCAGSQGDVISLTGVGATAGNQSFAGGRAVAFVPGGSVTFTSGGVTRTIANFVNVPLAQTNAAFNSTSAQFRELGSGQDRQFITPRQQRYNLYSAGHYDVTDHVQLYAQFLVSQLKTAQQSAVQQEFTGVPASNPFNPFGINVTPIVFFNSAGLGQNRTDRTFTQALGGAKGDLGFLGAGNPFSDWHFEQFFSFTRSVGTQTGRNILEDNLNLAINTARVVGGRVVCGTSITFDPLGFLTPNACVPVNLFAPNLLQNGQLSAAEAAFLIGDRSLRTINEQTVVGGTIDGDVPYVKLPGGKISLALGYEWRRDFIDGNGDFITEGGGAAGFTQDRDTQGRLDQLDAYAEVGLPILKDLPGVKELTVEGGGRFVHSPLFTDTGVWTSRLLYKPIQSLSLRGTAGTSYRTPNVNDLFLGGQSGFINGLADLCVAANGGPPDVRSSVVLANCRAQGVNPTTLGGGAAPGIQTVNSGGRGLQPERSFSYTASVAYSPDFLEALKKYNVLFNVTYVNYRIKGGVSRLGAANVIANCLLTPNLTAASCSRFTRDPATGLITLVNNTPFNLNTETESDVDFSASFARNFNWLGKDWRASATGTATRNFDSTVSAPPPVPGGAPSVFNDETEFFNPRWRATAAFFLDVEKFGFAWNTTLSGAQVNNNTRRAAPATAGFFAGLAADDFVRRSHLHNVSVSYTTKYGALSFGVRNLLNRQPDLVDSSLDFGATNTVGSGQDIVGRTFTLNFTAHY